MANPYINSNKHIINIAKYRWCWLCLSAILLAPGIISMIYMAVTSSNHLPLKVGIDYTGGTVLQYSVQQKISGEDIANTRTNLQKAGVQNPNLQIIHVEPTAQNKNAQAILNVKTQFLGENNNNQVDKVTTIIKKEYKGPELVAVNSVGPTLGKELFKNSLIAVALACLGIIAYLSIRFKLDFAVSAVLALIHDVIFVVGCFSLLGLFFNVQIDGLFITAILTVVGFSVHDTIVVYDRIRENLRYFSKKMSFSEIVNVSVNQTLTRSINTSLTTLITLGALYIFGGVTTRDFVLAMILGIAIGTYSSIFFASMLVDIWEERKEKKRIAPHKSTKETVNA